MVRKKQQRLRNLKLNARKWFGDCERGLSPICASYLIRRTSVLIVSDAQPMKIHSTEANIEFDLTWEHIILTDLMIKA